MRFFASLRFAQNDRHFYFGMEEVGGCATNLLHPLSNARCACHSERSEESQTSCRSVVNKFKENFLNLVLNIQHN